MPNNVSPTRRPSDAEWATHLPRICELYYGLRYTLEDTQRILQQETGFFATLRMYKDRIRNMAVHPKKICMQKYQAMSVVAEDYQKRGLNIHFIGPSGFQVFKRTPAQITKQLRRPHSLQPITLEEANDVLQQSNIRVVVEPHAMSQDLSAPTLSNPATVYEQGGSHEQSAAGTPGYTMLPPSVPDYDTTPTTLPTNLLAGAMLPPPMANNANIAFHQVDWNYPQNPRMQMGPPFPQPLHDHGPSLKPIKGESLSLAGINLLPERLSQPKPQRDDDDSYDFSADFAALSLTGIHAAKATAPLSAVVSRVLPPPSSVERRRMVIECAAPFFLDCFQRDDPHMPVSFSKAVAMERFKYILTATPGNQFVLPLLNWMSTVLSSNRKTVQLKEFVAECCQVLDTCEDYGFPMATPFRYMQAFCDDDEDAMQYHGSSLERGTERLVQLYGADHPNVLVNEYHDAWHTLRQPAGWVRAREILRSCSERSEKSMGRQNLMTLNCMAVLGRGHSENGDHAEAKRIYDEMLLRFPQPPQPLQAYRLIIVQRLAESEEHLGELSSAEHRFRQVYEGRLQLLSAFDPETKAAMLALANILRRSGNLSAAESVQQHYDREHERQCAQEYSGRRSRWDGSYSSGSSTQDSPDRSTSSRRQS
jgi:hypothetical protein